MSEYEIWCCGAHVATVTLKNDRVAKHLGIRPPDGETPHLSIGTVPTISRLSPADVHTWVHEDAAGRHVTEFRWSDGHRSWVIRCLACSHQFEITEGRLRWLAYILQAGDWSSTEGIVPLKVLGDPGVSGLNRA